MARISEVQDLASLARLKRRMVRRPSADVRATSVVALQSGGQIVPHPFHADAPQAIAWDQAGDCLEPVLLVEQGEGHLHEALHSRASRVEAAWEPNRTLERKLRCRVCSNCLRYRRRLWVRRAVREWRAAQLAGARSWFVTLTFAPEIRYRLLLETRDRCGEGFDRLSPVDQFRELLRTLKPLVTKWLKRLRGPGRAAVQFRYLLVVERHADGWPHFHALLHEVDDLRSVKKADIEDQWSRHGFASAKLVKDARLASYAAKYLGKSADARVRASNGYGGGDGAGAPPPVVQKF